MCADDYREIFGAERHGGVICVYLVDGGNRAFSPNVANEYTRMAGDVDVEIVAGNVYAYGSELTILRLFHKMPTGRAAYSANLETWYFSPRREY